MGHHQPHPLTPPATLAAGQVHWTQFQARNLPTDWTDPVQAHRTIMKLFPDDLHPDPKQSRTTANILFRDEIINNELHILIQSTIQPVVTPAETRHRVTTIRHAPGQHVRFRLAVNPIRRGSTAKNGIVVPTDELGGWLITKLEPALTDITIFNHCRDDKAHINPSGKHTVIIDTFEGAATVNQTTELERLLRVGIGRAKPYGAGLLTVLPIPA